MTVFVVLIVSMLFGSLAPLFFRKNYFDHEDVQQNFFAGPNSFHSIMVAMSKLSYQVLGADIGTTLGKLYLMLLLGFLGALSWYTLQVTGLSFYLDFLWRGMTLELGDDGRNWLAQYWPWVYLDFSRNSGREISIANQYLEALALTLAIFMILSASFSMSIFNSVALVHKLGRERFRTWQALLRMLFSMCLGLAIDLLFFLVFLILIIVAGRALNFSVEEIFNANASDRRSNTDTHFLPAIII
jgi:hypothetical protein